MKLEQLINHIEYQEIKGDLTAEVSAVEFDSRTVNPGTLFIAQRGLHSDGHHYIGAAVEKGAVAVVCEEFPSLMTEDITYIKVADTFYTTGILASAFYDFPSEKMK